MIVPLMRKRFVEDLNWIDEEEMLNIIAIAQSAPGPISVNASILVGYKIAGVMGALLAILGTVTPPLVIITIIASFYSAFRSNPIVAAALYGMQAGVAAIIADVVITMVSRVVRRRRWSSILIMLVAFIAATLGGFPVSLIILGSGMIGALRLLWQRRIKEDQSDEEDDPAGEAEVEEMSKAAKTAIRTTAEENSEELEVPDPDEEEEEL